MPRDTSPFPVLRWVALAWMIVWLPAYARVWGWANLLHLCDLAVILACAGFWWGSPLLISSQAVSLLVPGVLWCLDAGWKLAAGLLILSRFMPAALNLNYAYRDPLLHRAWGPAPVHLGVTLVVLVAVLY